MKGVLTLKGENEEEKQFLTQAGIEGLRNFGTGTTNVLALPSTAELKQFHLSCHELTMVAYMIGKAEGDLRRSYPSIIVSELVSKLLG